MADEHGLPQSYGWLDHPRAYARDENSNKTIELDQEGFVTVYDHDDDTGEQDCVCVPAVALVALLRRGGLVPALRYPSGPVHGIVRGRGPCHKCGIRAWKWRFVVPPGDVPKFQEDGRRVQALVCMGCDHPNRGDDLEWFMCPTCNVVGPHPAADASLVCPAACGWIAHEDRPPLDGELAALATEYEDLLQEHSKLFPQLPGNDQVFKRTKEITKRQLEIHERFAALTQEALAKGADDANGNPGRPRFAQGERVFTRGTENGGRVQQVTYDGAFLYIVKWDNGPTTPHVEGELQPAPLPPHYP